MKQIAKNRSWLGIWAVWVLVALAGYGMGAPCGLRAQGVDSGAVKVRLNFASRRDLQDLLQRVPLEGFSREAVRPQPGSEALAVELWISPWEADALRALGLVVQLVVAPPTQGATVAADDDFIAYLNNEEIGDICASWATAYPDLARRFQWGTSLEGRPLWGLVISDDVQHSAAETEVRLAATMHGDEPIGTVMLLNLAQYLLTRYGQSGQEDLTALVDAREIHILPLLNPDGYAYGIRTNALAVDLNRDFPEPNGYHQEQAPETLAFMDYARRQHFAVSLNTHSGALVVNYPWDYSFTLTADDEAIKVLSQDYANLNPPMLASDYFPGGITHGASWYAANGTLQDWSYAVTGCIDLTVELSGIKKPATSLLPGLWEDNRESLLQFIRAADFGLYGSVVDSLSRVPLAASIAIAGNPQTVATDPQYGDYSKLLPTGTWQVTFTAEGYDTLTVADVPTVWGVGTELDVALLPSGTRPPLPVNDLVLSVGSSPGPGPFDILYDGGETLRSRLRIFDLRGYLVADLGPLSGRGQIQWDGRSARGATVPSGSYFLRLESETGAATARLVLVR